MFAYCGGPAPTFNLTRRHGRHARPPRWDARDTPLRLWRTEGAGGGPRFHELAKLGLCSGCGRAPSTRRPRPADQAVRRNMMDQRKEITAAIAGAILDLGADLRQRSALPGHRRRREMPVRMAGNVAGVEIASMVTGRARHSGGTMSVSAANNNRLVRAHPIGLRWALGRRMAVHAARMLEHFAGFCEQRDRACAAVRDLVEAGDGLQLPRKRLSWECLRGGFAIDPHC